MEKDLDKLNVNWDERMAALKQQPRRPDNLIMIDYRNSIAISASAAPRLDDINARFLVEELQDKIAEAIAEFDRKRAEL